MARLGGKTSDKETENGRKFVGDKDVGYLEHLSRQSVEEHNDSSVLYFELDWEASKRNFYGELLIKKFKNINGIAVKVKPFIIENEANLENGILNQTLSLNVSVYTEHLKELNIAPKIDDYFALGYRIYRIYKRSIVDSGVSGNLLIDRKNIEIKYYCVQIDVEQIQKDAFGENLGLESQFNAHRGFNQ